jgi:hypothetical protein
MPEIYKWYVADWKRREKPEDWRWVDYRFFHDSAEAATWPTEDLVEADRILLMNTRIAIDLPDGSRYPCGEFKSEMTKAGDYVLYCELPFPISEAKATIRE